MSALKRSHDRKTANRANGAGEQSALKNAFSLPSGTEYSCPGATSVCDKVCYAGKLERQYPAYRALGLHNWELLTNATYNGMCILLWDMIDEFVKECEKHSVPKIFRWHADGDIFSEAYAQAIAETCRSFPDVQFWIYTRSFEYVEWIAPVRNLSVYLSVDSENQEKAMETYAKFPDMVKLAYLADTHEIGKEALVEETGRRGVICPENAKTIELITPKGGACMTCGLCVFGRDHVRFAIKVPKRKPKKA